ncbi:MAG: hypothetical protein M1305_04670, partial [Candidatus Marsarchaeota archaeon]|nr:hypothetical protein [Candidatus Marsarchaeota archaeon]
YPLPATISPFTRSIDEKIIRSEAGRSVEMARVSPMEASVQDFLFGFTRWNDNTHVQTVWQDSGRSSRGRLPLSCD